MNDLQPKTMTVKQVSEALGVSTDLIKKRIREILPNKMKNGKVTYLNEYEVTCISSRIKENSSLVTYDDRNRLATTDGEMIQKLNEVMGWLSSKVKEVESRNEQLQIELDESLQWHTVKKVKTLGYLKDVSARKAWSPLRTWSLENDYQIKTIEDVNYGTVKLYHSDAWKAVYGVVL